MEAGVIFLSIVVLVLIFAVIVMSVMLGDLKFKIDTMSHTDSYAHDKINALYEHLKLKHSGSKKLTVTKDE